MSVKPILTGVEILKSQHHSPNGGLSQVYRVVDVYPTGTLASEVEGNVDRAVTIEAGNLRGTVIAEPIVTPVDTVGPMASGAYIASSDSRLSELVEKVLGHRFYGAIPLHDRFETFSQYRSFSR